MASTTQLCQFSFNVIMNNENFSFVSFFIFPSSLINATHDTQIFQTIGNFVSETI